MRFQIKGLDNVKLSEHARLCIESLFIPIIYDADDDRKSISQSILRMSNLSSINCFDTHGNGQTAPVIFTAQTNITMQRVRNEDDKSIMAYQNSNQPQVFL
jgi:hypothetical protein